MAKNLQYSFAMLLEFDRRLFRHHLQRTVGWVWRLRFHLRLVRGTIERTMGKKLVAAMNEGHGVEYRCCAACALKLGKT